MTSLMYIRDIVDIDRSKADDVREIVYHFFVDTHRMMTEREISSIR